QDQEAEENGPVVAATPVAPAEPPAESKPADQPQASDPVRAAEKSAIAARLAETERAEQLARQPVNQPQQPQHPVEPQEPQEPIDPVEMMLADPRVPERVKNWYRTDPSLLTNPKRAAQANYCHFVACEEVDEGTDEYFARMEHMLGFRQETKPNGSGNGHAEPRAAPSRPAPDHSRGQAARPQRSASVAYSAPISREAPSMSTGRPLSNSQISLTAEEVEFAKQCKIRPEESDQEAVRRYAADKMKALKDGAIGPGARDGRS